MQPEQHRVEAWVRNTFGDESMQPRERSLRAAEEMIELLQALGDITPWEILQLLVKKWNQPSGDPHQELGGVMITLLALCAQHKLEAYQALQDEWIRINQPEMIEKIRAKQKIKLGEGF